MQLEARTRDAARRLIKSRLRHAVFTHQLGVDSGAAQVEEGIIEDAQEDWQQVLASWDLSVNRSEVLAIIDGAFRLAREDIQALFEDAISPSRWEEVATKFVRGFNANELLP